tara:strand:+ start:1055 stop:1726 length:672 start_codon:yes stop_codon:yes gene_type:complete
MRMSNGIILASGGLDSSVLANYVKKKLNKKISLLFFNYNQKSYEEELYCVKKLSRKLKSKLKIIDVRWLGDISTSLINKSRGGKQEIIKWYVPFRNSIFLCSALAHAESEFISKKIKQDIYIGIKHEGELSFNDTKPAFLKSINNLAKHAQKGRFKIKAPFINKDKEDIIEFGKKLGVDFQDTYSCYIEGKNKKLVHCGKCSACKGRKKGFKFSNVIDSTLYI